MGLINSKPAESKDTVTNKSSNTPSQNKQPPAPVSVVQPVQPNSKGVPEASGQNQNEKRISSALLGSNKPINGGRSRSKKSKRKRRKSSKR